MSRKPPPITFAPGLVGLAALVALGTQGCSNEDECNKAGYDAGVTAADFPNPTRIDNPYYPLVPGTTYRFTTSEANVVDTVVTADTRDILGVTCVVVHDFEKSPAGDLLEDTYDWFAQDKLGNVWYFGEDTTAYLPGGKTSKAGSWEAGKDCAQQGIVMKASPAVGDSYRQEYRAGTAEDKADVLSLTEKVTVPYGTFEGCLLTKDYTDLEPGKAEHKYYCRGLGLVSTIDLVTVGTPPHEDLAAVTGPGADGDAGTGSGDAGSGS